MHRKKRPVRIRPKNVVSLHKKMIQRGAKVKDAPKRIGSGARDGQEAWDREKTMAENYAVGLPSFQHRSCVLRHCQHCRLWEILIFSPYLPQAIGLNAGLNKKLNNFTGVMTAEMYRREMGLGDIALDSDEEVEDEQAGEAPTSSVVAMQQACTQVQAHNETVGPRMTSGERKFVESLVKAHGLNYKAMAKNIKLNRSQETAGHLRRKVERYAKIAGVSVDSLATSRDGR